MFVNMVIESLHWLPHFNFRLRKTSDVFDYNYQSDYIQALEIYGIASLIIALFFLLIIIVVWICQCCLRKENNQRSRRRIRNLTIGLFTISVFCFAFLGGCLYANETINRGVRRSVSGLEDIHRNLKVASTQLSALNNSQSSAKKHVQQLVTLIAQKTPEIPGINKTLINNVDNVLTLVDDKVDDVKLMINRLNVLTADIRKVDTARAYVDRIEFERWVLFITLLSIIIAVLFLGVIAFCQQSRKGSITFSAMGVVTFIVTWVLVTVVVPMSIGHADFCATTDKFLQSRIKAELFKSLEFYRSCEASGPATLPPNLPIDDINKQFNDIQQSEATLVNILNIIFNHSGDITNATNDLQQDVINSFKSVGALESMLTCYNVQSDVKDTVDGVCHDAVIGTAVLLLSSLLLGLSMFILLIVVCQTWHVFIRLPSDYIEVGEDDPFYPRQQDTVIPADIYGTHVFNHRTRFTPSSLEHTENSTGTTNATNANNQSAPLMDSTWQRPPNTGTNSAATGNSVLRSSMYPGSEDPYRYRNYQEQFEV